MPGNNTVIVDADTLIGLIHETDALHARSLRVASFLDAKHYTSIVPAPIVLEAATVLAKDKSIRWLDLARKLEHKRTVLVRTVLFQTGIPLYLFCHAPVSPDHQRAFDLSRDLFGLVHRRGDVSNMAPWRF